MKKSEVDYFFEDLPVLGEMPPKIRAIKFEEFESKKDISTAKAIREDLKASSMQGFTFLGRGKKRPCENTAHTFGFIPQLDLGKEKFVEIKHASNIEPDMSLKNKRIKITLGALGAADYPGDGMHRILFDFYAQNQLPTKQVEKVHFNQTFRVQDGQQAGIIGYPIFIGLNVGSQGIDFKCYTVNVKNDNDEKILNFLGGDVFKSGLKLAKTAQPAIVPLANIAVGITRMVASRNKNVPVQDIFMGLDFSATPFTARLSKGSYVAVQIPQEDRREWDWKNWVYDQQNMLVVNKDDKNQLIPYNFIIFNVNEYTED